MPVARSPRGRAFTLTEMLVVIGIIVVLVGILLPALGGVWSSGEMTKSMNNLRQVATWVRQYASENADLVVPSRFDYRGDPYPGKVRSHPSPRQGEPHTGTWCDILQTVFGAGAYPDAVDDLGHDYRYDAPDRPLYDLIEDGVRSPFRSAARNTRMCNPRDFDSSSPDPPKPFGPGAQELGLPGLFAANDFFNAGWIDGSGEGFYSSGQIRFPDRSMYLVDSYAGETIEHDFMAPGPDPGGEDQSEVDFRYLGETTVLMLFLDGHVDTLNHWESIEDLEARKVRVCGLDKRSWSCTEEP